MLSIANKLRVSLAKISLTITVFMVSFIPHTVRRELTQYSVAYKAMVAVVLQIYQAQLFQVSPRDNREAAKMG
jgi:hypothetical protein